MQKKPTIIGLSLLIFLLSLCVPLPAAAFDTGQQCNLKNQALLAYLPNIDLSKLFDTAAAPATHALLSGDLIDKALINRYIDEIELYRAGQLAPDCLGHIALGSAEIAIMSIYYYYFFLDTGMSDLDECSMKYFSYSIMWLYAGLIKWIDYRLCAQDSAQGDINDRLQQDRQYLQNAMASFFGASVFFSLNCDMPLFPEY